MSKLWYVRVFPSGPQRKPHDYHVCAPTHLEAIDKLIKAYPDYIGRRCEVSEITTGVVRI